MSRRSDFVLSVTEELKKNPRRVLAGHGIPAAVLQIIIGRDDVMAKLANILYSMKTAKKGPNGLKKTANFRIFAYKNFPTFNGKAREDVEIFAAGLNPKDAATFSNKDSIVTILMLPDTKSIDGEGNLTSDIISGKSVVLNFETSVKKEYKIPGGAYLAIMIGDSAIRPAEERLAKVQSKRNAKKQIRRTPSKIKAELKTKANKKLRALDSKRRALQSKRKALQAQQAARSSFAGKLGVDNLLNAFDEFDTNVSNISNRAATISKGLRGNARALFDTAKSFVDEGNIDAARAVLSKVNNQQAVSALQDYIESTAGELAANSPRAKYEAKKTELRRNVRSLKKRLEELQVSLALAPANKVRSVKSMISKTKAALAKARTQYNGLSNISADNVSKKAAALQKINKEIEANIAKGQKISETLNNAISKLDLRAAKKRQVKQDIIDAVQSGVPMQYAVQQAIQNQDFGDALGTGPDLTDTFDIDDLIAGI